MTETQSQTPAGITFRETMCGGFALGESDPEAGSKKGKKADTELAMHAVVVIDDVDRFIAEAGHAGGLSGTLDFPPFGNGIPAPSGVFNLFSPTDDPKLKLMVYELGFEHGGEAWYLAGRKEVRDDSLLELWPATTTLYTQLHRGRDKSGPVAGAGILRLGPAQLLKLVSSMKVTGAESPKEKARALGAFGQFFLGELWDTYVKHADA